MTTARDIQIDIQVASTASGLPDADELQSWVLAALQGSRHRQREHATELTVRIVDEAESRELNDSYRGKPYATNVLSFPAELPPELPLELLGDLVICAPVVAREAGEQRKPVQAHWAHMVVHGVLHLLGYDHVDESDAELMENLEITILSGLNITNPYSDV